MKINTTATAETIAICFIVNERLTRKLFLQRYGYSQDTLIITLRGQSILHCGEF